MDLALGQQVVDRRLLAEDPVRRWFVAQEPSARAQEKVEMEAEWGQEGRPRLVVSRAPNMACPTVPT